MNFEIWLIFGLRLRSLCIREKRKWKLLSHVQLFATPWTLQSMGFSGPERTGHWLALCLCHSNLPIKNNPFAKVGQCGIQVWQPKDKLLYIENDNEEPAGFLAW